MHNPVIFVVQMVWDEKMEPRPAVGGTTPPIEYGSCLPIGWLLVLTNLSTLCTDKCCLSHPVCFLYR